MSTTLRPSVDRGIASFAVILICVGIVEAAQALMSIVAALSVAGPSLGGEAMLASCLEIARPLALVLVGGAMSSMRSPARALAIYWSVAGAHTLFVLAPWLRAPSLPVAVFALQLVAWPVVLAIVARRPGIRAALERPAADDGRAIEGLGVLMFLFGAGIVVATPYWAMWIANALSVSPTKSVVATGMGHGFLAITAVLELIAGRGLLTGANLERVFVASRRAHRTAWISAAALGFGVVSMFDRPAYLDDTPDPFLMSSIALALFFAAAIVVGPWAFARVIRARRTAWLAAGNLETNGPIDEDRGLSALGWVLLAIGATGVVAALGEIVGVPSRSLGAVLHMFGNPYARLAALRRRAA